jgi:hypothetical protein
MPFKLFGRKKKTPMASTDPMEMGPVQEGGDLAPVNPGQPVPFEATSWAPPKAENGDVMSLYQTGPADLDPAPGAIDPYKPAPEPPSKAHMLKKPDVDGPRVYMDDDGDEWVESTKAPATKVEHECMNCGHIMRVSRKRPIKVKCSDCGETDVLR